MTDTQKRRLAEIEAERAAVDAAAVEWCGEKGRETFMDDVLYFKHNWRWMPGFKARVERHIEARARQQEPK